MDGRFHGWPSYHAHLLETAKITWPPFEIPLEEQGRILEQDQPRSREHSSASSVSVVWASHSSICVEATSTQGLRHRHARKSATEYEDIWKAAGAGCLEEVDRHIGSGANANAHHPSYDTPLSTAACHGRSKVVALLLSKARMCEAPRLPMQTLLCKPLPRMAMAM